MNPNTHHLWVRIQIQILKIINNLYNTAKLK